MLSYFKKILLFPSHSHFIAETAMSKTTWCFFVIQQMRCIGVCKCVWCFYTRPLSLYSLLEPLVLKISSSNYNDRP